jgi:hypothetical protein
LGAKFNGNGNKAYKDLIISHNSGLAKVAVQFSADPFVVKIATFTKPETFTSNAIATL